MPRTIDEVARALAIAMGGEGSGGGAVDSVNGQIGEVIINKGTLGLGNVDNTSDLDKPISTATQNALDDKQDALSNGANIQIVGGQINTNVVSVGTEQPTDTDKPLIFVDLDEEVDEVYTKEEVDDKIEKIVVISNDEPIDAEKPLVWIDLEEEVSEISAVLYNVEQTLTDEQKQQARDNIGVEDVVTIVQVEGDSETSVMSQKAVTDALSNTVKTIPQTLTIDEQNQARENLGIVEADISSVFEFTSADLIFDELTIAHNKETDDVIVSVYNDLGNQVIPTEVVIVSDSVIEISFIGIQVDNTWKVVVQGGKAVITSTEVAENAVLFVPQTLTDDEKTQAKSNLGITIGEASSEFFFTSADLVDNKFNITHSKNSDAVVVSVYNSVNNQIIPKEVTIISDSEVVVDLEGITVDGTWKIVIVGGDAMIGSTTIAKNAVLSIPQTLNTEEKKQARLNIDAVEQTITKSVLDATLETNTEYTVSLGVDTTITDAIGWGIINITATANFTLNIPTSHKWADGLDGFIENATQIMVMYDNGRWSRIDWR